MINLKHVSTFLTIAQQGTFSKAAETLGLAQPTISLHIKALEKALGYDLFDRIGKHAVMTGAGKRFLTIATEMIRLANEAELYRDAQEIVSGTIKLCIVDSVCTYLMPKILRKFNKRYPNIRLSISTSRPSTYMLEQLRYGEFDGAIVLEAPFDIPVLSSHALWTESLQLVAYPSHPLASLETVDLAMLAYEPLILPQQGAYYRKIVETRFSEKGITLNSPLEIHSVEAIKRCVMAEIGLAILPQYAIEAEVKMGQLIPLMLDDRDFTVTVQLIWHSSKTLEPSLQAFINFITSSV